MRRYKNQDKLHNNHHQGNNDNAAPVTAGTGSLPA